MRISIFLCTLLLLFAQNVKATNNSDKHIIIYIALSGEGKKQITNVVKKLNLQDKVHIIYGGVGKINSSYGLTKEIIKLKSAGIKIGRIINLGGVGALNMKNFKSGELVNCDRFLQIDIHQSAVGYPAGITRKVSDNDDDMVLMLKNREDEFVKKLNLKNAICCTSDLFGDEKSHIYKINLPQEKKDMCVLEMEGYALEKVAAREDIHFIAIKYVVNGAEDGAKWKNTLHNSNAIGDNVSKFLQDYLQYYYK
jgi:nucleoside phosphorylase